MTEELGREQGQRWVLDPAIIDRRRQDVNVRGPTRSVQFKGYRYAERVRITPNLAG